MAGAHRIDSNYREHVRLADGTEVLLRLVRPEDVSLLQAGFERLSGASRYRRFGTARQRLTPAELRYLTHVDGENHLALGAARTGPSGEVVEGLGVARFVRSAEDPRVAEAAIAVVDAIQGRGLGRLLLTRLAEAARERGISHFTGEVVADNQPMLQLLHELVPPAVLRDAGPGALGFSVSLEPEAHAGPVPELLRRLLRLAAKGGFSLARIAGLAPPEGPGDAA